MFALSILSVSGASVPAATFTTLANFATSSGRRPSGKLFLDAHGNLYGTTTLGGPDDVGTIFCLNAGSSTPTTVVNFDLSSGHMPQGGLIADVAGNLYGTTVSGVFGKVFRLDAVSGALTTVLSLDYPTTGASPSNDLQIDQAGNLYATSTTGGSGGKGTVFRINADGTHVILANFDSTTGRPVSLMLHSDGNLYGTATGGGTSNMGAIYKISPGSDVPTLIANFNGANGSNPSPGLIADSNGDFYGTATGSNSIFKVDIASGTITTLAGTGGISPTGNLIADAAGNLYGTNSGGSDKGSVFKLAAGSNVVTKLVSFDGTNGQAPYAGLISDEYGNLYGTTSLPSHGTIFKITNAGFVLPVGPLNVSSTFASLGTSKKVSSFTMAGTPSLPTAKLDIGMFAFVVDYSDTVGNILSDTTARIVAARGTPGATTGLYPNTGNGINSSAVVSGNVIFNTYAVAAINNADLDAFNGPGSAYSTFGSLSVDATAVLLRYTYSGDANLDGKIDSADYSLINRGFAGTITNVGWLSGDFNLDGLINATDFAIIDFGFLKQGSALTLDSPVSVPEPGALAAVGTVGLTTLIRRRTARCERFAERDLNSEGLHRRRILSLINFRTASLRRGRPGGPIFRHRGKCGPPGRTLRRLAIQIFNISKTAMQFARIDTELDRSNLLDAGPDFFGSEWAAMSPRQTRDVVAHVA